MKLKNKRTGEIIDDGYVRETHDFQFDGQKHVLAVFKGNGHRPPERVSGAYKSLAELNEEWEDYEEPKGYWYLSNRGDIRFIDDEDTDWDNDRKEIGNYFETKEEAELAVRKLKAWKRLKDKGLHVTTFYVEDGSLVIRAKTHNSSGAENWDDLDLLFGGEE